MTRTAPLAYVRQRSADLTFYLFEAPAPRESIRVLSERVLHLQGAEMTLAIIGSSHFLEIRAGKRTLCEMVVCPYPGLDRVPRVAEMAGGASWEHRFCREGIQHQFELWRRHLDPDQFRQESDALAMSGSNRLQYLFPRGDDAGSAVTCLEWWTEGGRATVGTYHTFPNESTIVQTRSVIEVAQAGAAE